MRRGIGQAAIGALLVAACGDERGSSSGGDGGATGGAPPTATSTGASGGAGGESCAVDSAEDHTGESAVTIVSVGARYVPACVRVSAGSVLTFESNFATHPILGGEVIDGVETPDEASPITPTTTGTTASFTIGAPGVYPYYCDFHSSIGMWGVVFAE